MKTNLLKPTVPLLGILALLAGCTTVATVPQGSQTGVSQVSDVSEQPELHQDAEVTWGGTVVSVENRSDETWIEIIERPLRKDGLPDIRENSHGRFLAVVPGFLDPLDYSNGRAITVTGAIDGKETRKISAADYTYPVVAVADHRLWSAAQTRSNRHRYSSRIRYPYGYYNYPYRSRVSISFGHYFGHGFGFSRGHRHGIRGVRHGRFGFGRSSRGHKGGRFVSGRTRF